MGPSQSSLASSSTPFLGSGSRPTAIDDFDRTVLLHGPALQARARWLSGNHPDASDLFQDTMERALRASHRTVPQDKMPNWLKVIMHNLFVDRCRANKAYASWIDFERMAPDFADEPAGDEPHPRWQQVDVESIRAMLPRVASKLRRALELHLDGMAYSAIAVKLGIPVKTVGTRIHRARLQVRKLFDRQATSGKSKSRG